PGETRRTVALVEPVERSVATSPSRPDLPVARRKTVGLGGLGEPTANIRRGTDVAEILEIQPALWFRIMDGNHGSQTGIAAAAPPRTSIEAKETIIDFRWKTGQVQY